MTTPELIGLVFMIFAGLVLLVILWWACKGSHAEKVHLLEMHRMDQGFNYEKAMMVEGKAAEIEVERTAWAAKNPSPKIPRQRDSRYDS